MTIRKNVTLALFFCLRWHVLTFLLLFSPALWTKITAEKKRQNTTVTFFRVDMKNTPGKFDFWTLLESGRKCDFRESKYSSSPKVSKELDKLFLYFGRRFLKQPCTARRTKEASLTSSPCWCDHVNMLASKYSTFWLTYGLKKNCMDFTIDRLNPYPTTPLQIIRTIPISHQLQLARQNQLRRCIPFVNTVTWICFLLWFSVYPWFYCQKVEFWCYAFIWNQLVVEI